MCISYRVPHASGRFLFWPLMVHVCSSSCSTGVHSALCGDVGVAATDEYWASRHVSAASLIGGEEGEEREEGGRVWGTGTQSHGHSAALTHVHWTGHKAEVDRRENQEVGKSPLCSCKCYLFTEHKNTCMWGNPLILTVQLLHVASNPGFWGKSPSVGKSPDLKVCVHDVGKCTRQDPSLLC